MNKRILPGLSLLAILCACAGFLPDMTLRVVLVLGVGLALVGWIVWYSGQAAAASKPVGQPAEDITAPVANGVVMVPPAPPVSGSVSVAGGNSDDGPLRALNKLAELKNRWMRDVDSLTAGVQEVRALEGEVDAACATQKQALESIHQGSQMIHANSTQANAIAENLAGNAEKASELSNQVQEKVDFLVSDLELSIKQVEYLLEESKKINGILEIMNQIASSTHVLGINASIVAARAGQQGLAFDVVAREIRNLAESTGASLQDIETLIKHIQETVALVADKTRKTSASILGEKKTLLDVAGALQGVILSVEVIRTMTSVAADTALDLQKQVNMAASSANDRLDHSHFKSMEARLDAAVTDIRQFLEQVDAI